MINVDISNIWGQASLPGLLELEAAVAAAHAALTGNGEAGEPAGWLRLPTAQSPEELSRIQEVAGLIRESSDVLVVLGNGSACLGAQGAIGLLRDSRCGASRGKGDPLILFAGNTLSTRRWNELIRLLEGKDFSLCIISKSGDALEPAIALRNLRWMLERRYGTDEARSRIFAVTGPEGRLRQMADREGWECFSIPEDVDSRFSVLSPAGLLPMAAAGIDIVRLLRGAAEARDECDLRSFENPVWLYAAVRKLMERTGMAIEVLGYFEPAFRTMGDWWQQLFAGAEGREGAGIFPATAQYPGDDGSLGQLIREGRRNVFETMLRFDPPEHAMTIIGDVTNTDGLNYLEGRQLDSVEEQVFCSTVAAHADSGAAVIWMDCGTPDEGKLGELFWFFQLSCAVSALIPSVDPRKNAGSPAQ